jgi:DNA-directed RNA polymerase specialized sigma24 family protein
MSYNYGREVRRLQNRQAQEDAELREAGVSEVFIEILHKMNWRDLKADRVFYTHNVQSIDDIFNIVTYTTHDEATVDNIEELLVMIDNPALRQLLMDTDKLTLKMLFLKMQGYSVDDIAMELGKQTDAVYKRLSRIKKKIKFTLA